MDKCEKVEHLELRFCSEFPHLFKENDIPRLTANSKKTMKFFKANIMGEVSSIKELSDLPLTGLVMGLVHYSILHTEDIKRIQYDFPHVEYLEFEPTLEEFVSIERDPNALGPKYGEIITDFKFMAFNPPPNLKTLKLILNDIHTEALRRLVNRLKPSKKLILTGQIFTNIQIFIDNVPDIAVKLPKTGSMNLDCFEKFINKFERETKLRRITFLDVDEGERKKMKKSLVNTNRLFDQFGKPERKYELSSEETKAHDDDISFSY